MDHIPPAAASPTPADLEQEVQRLKAELALAQQRFEHVFESLDESFVILDREFRYTYVNENFVRLSATPHEKLIGFPFYEVFPEAANPELQYFEAYRKTLAGEPQRFLEYYEPFDTWTEIRCYPIPEGIAIFLGDISQAMREQRAAEEIQRSLRQEREQAQTKLADNQRLYHNLMDHFPNGTVNIVDSELRVQYVAGRLLNEIQVPAEQAIGTNLLTWFQPEFHAAIQSAIAAGFQGQLTILEAALLSPAVWLELQVAPLPTASGEIAQVMIMAQDITDRKAKDVALSASLREKEVLLMEIHHRVKNNLAILNGLLQLQALRTQHKESQDILTQMQARVLAMALVHQTLYQHEDWSQVEVAAYTQKLCADLSSIFAQPQQHIQLHYQLQPIFLDVTKAIPFGLIVAESVGNAFKHAFVQRSTGNIHVRLQLQNQTVLAEIEDDGPGIKGASAPMPHGLGLNLLHGLSQQLGAALDIHADGYTRIRLSFPQAD